MAGIRDQIKESSTRKGYNTIKDRVSFSGADITVVAYRGDSPASKFKVDSLKKDIAENESRLSRLEAQQAAQDALNLGKIEDLSADIESLERRKRELLASGVPTTSSSVASFEGKAQNKRFQLDQAVRNLGSENPEIPATRDALEHLNANLEDLEKADKYFELGSIHTLSYSSFREKFAVRTLGRVHANGYTRGPRTIAGSMIFNVFQEHDFLRMVDYIEKPSGRHPNAVMLDQIQPFNILLLFANEFGAYSALHLIDVEISSEGQEMSVDSIITFNTMNFYANDMIPMTNLGNRFNTYDEMIIGTIRDVASLGFSSTERPKRNSIDSLINPFKDDGKDKELLAASRGLF